MPKGDPLTSTERMRLKKLRDLGKLPPLPRCKECQRVMKVTSGHGESAKLGLCWSCWKETKTGQKRRRCQNLRLKIWPVMFFSYDYKTDKLPVSFTKAGDALSHAYAGPQLVKNGPLIIVCNNGEVSQHWQITRKTASTLLPEDGDSVLACAEYGPDWFRDQVPENKRDWFFSPDHID